MHLTDYRSRHVLWALALSLPITLVWLWIPHPLIAPLIGLLPLAILFIIKAPVLIGLLFMLFSFFRLHEVFPQLYNLKIPLLLALATLATLAWHSLLSRKIIPYGSRELSAFAAFFLLVTLGMVFASNRPEAFSYWNATYVKIGIMTPVLAWLLREPHHFALTLRLIAAAGVTVGGMALYNSIAGIGLIEGTRVTIGRDLGSVLGDPNDLALVLLFPLSFATALTLNKGNGRFDRLLGIISGLILISAIIATQSRGGLLGILAVLAVFGIRRIKSKVLLTTLGALTLALLFLVAGVSDRQSGGAAEEGLDESAMGRLHAWDAAFGMALDNPLSGVGLNNFYFNYFYYSSHWDGLNHAVHSTWFGVLGETGFLGLGFFLVMVVMTLRCSASTVRAVDKQSRTDPIPPSIHTIAEGNLAGLVGFCVSGTFLTQGFTWPLYILLALTVAVAHYASCGKASRLTE